MNFIPYYNKIEVRPIKKESHILSEDESLLERGEVIAVGRDVTFVKIGDEIAFDSWGCQKTPSDSDGVFHYVVPEDNNVILGKYESTK